MYRPGDRHKSKTFLVLSALLLVTSCATVSLTGRKQLNLVPDSEMLAMSQQQYTQFLSENKAGANATQNTLVQQVGKKIQAAVEESAKETNRTKELEGYAWEFNVVESDQVNAWCLPGGKVVFYTGILPVCKDETGIAVVMGHEVAHAVAKHGSERMSQQMLLQLGGTALSTAIKTHPTETQQLWMGKAGYDPNSAVAFWQRMAAASGGEKPPEFMSTHPSDETRIKKIKEHLPEAMKYYKKP